MFHKFLKDFNAPQSSKVDKVLFKKALLDNAKLDITDKKVLKQDVEKITILYNFNTQNMNINRYKSEDYDYMEVSVLHISLYSKQRARRIAEFINKAIPYPLIIFFTHNDCLSVSVANKRINKADKSKVVLEKVLLTDFIDLHDEKDNEKDFLEDFKINNMSFDNFYSFYQSFKDSIISLQVAEKTGVYDSQDMPVNRLEILTKIENLEAEIEVLRKEHKIEDRFNKKMELNISIKEKKKELKELEGKL